MTYYEMLTIAIAFIAIVVSTVSLVRTRKLNDVQIKLNEISAELTQRQLTRLVTDEPLIGQPRFAIHKVAGISGLGNPHSSSFRIKVKFHVEKHGEPVSKFKGVSLLTVENGTFRQDNRAWVEPTDTIDVIGEHTLTLVPPVDLKDSFLVISYVDMMGKDKFAQFRVFLEGRPSVVPSAVFFDFHQVSTLVPSTPWHFRPDD